MRFPNISIWYESVCKLANLRNDALFSPSQCFTPKPLSYDGGRKWTPGHSSSPYLWVTNASPGQFGKKGPEGSLSLTTEFRRQFPSLFVPFKANSSWDMTTWALVSKEAELFWGHNYILHFYGSMQGECPFIQALASLDVHWWAQLPAHCAFP